MLRLSAENAKKLTLSDSQLKILLGEQKLKPNKHRNTRMYEHENGVTINYKDEARFGKVVASFDSIKESNRWAELKMLEKAGQISELKRQVVMIIQEETKYRGEKIRAISYKADFQYVGPDGITVVEDVKAFDNRTQKYITTKDFNLKWKLLKAKYPKVKFIIL